MTQWILDNIFTIVSTVFGGGSLAALFLEKNKRRIQDRQLSADALVKMQEAYSVFTTDSTNRYEQLKSETEKQIGYLNEKINDIAKELLLEKQSKDTINSENLILKKENDILQKELKDCKETL